LKRKSSRPKPSPKKLDELIKLIISGLSCEKASQQVGISSSAGQHWVSVLVPQGVVKLRQEHLEK
jgi:transposase